MYSHLRRYNEKTYSLAAWSWKVIWKKCSTWNSSTPHFAGTVVKRTRMVKKFRPKPRAARSAPPPRQIQFNQQAEQLQNHGGNWLVVVVSFFFILTPTWGRFPLWLNIFQMGWNHQLVDNFHTDLFVRKPELKWQMGFFNYNISEDEHILASMNPSLKVWYKPHRWFQHSTATSNLF